MPTIGAKKLRFYDLEPEADTFHDDVIQGLKQAQKRIPPKHFYDERGSRLFDAICTTDEYYPTRTEMAILDDNCEDICRLLGSDCVLVEPGSGSSQKVRLILDRLEPHTYMPLDISSEHLKSTASGLASEYPHINITAACLDYTQQISLPDYPEGRRSIAFFPGSSIGNFEHEDAVKFLGNLATLVRPRGGLLIGVDLKKETSILNAAYNDRDKITAQFNLNLLSRINTELEADFNPDRFEHLAFYNENQGRIEIYLVSTCNQLVTVAGHRFKFRQGESIHTENSYKYTIDEFRSLALKAGFTLRKAWTDAQSLFSVQYYEIKQ